MSGSFVRRRITIAISAAIAHSAPEAYQTTSYEPKTSRARPPRKATTAAPTWCEASTQPKTIALSSPYCSRHRAMVGGTVATQSRP